MSYLNFDLHTVLADLASIASIIYVPLGAFAAYFATQKKTKKLALRLLKIATILFVAATIIYFAALAYESLSVVNTKSVPIHMPPKTLNVPYTLFGVSGYTIGSIPLWNICISFALSFITILFSIVTISNQEKKQRFFN